MSILVRFATAPSMTNEMYDESVRHLESTLEQWPADGMQYHVAFTAGGSFRVSEIWESQEKFEAFGQTLMPILAELGIELAGEPEIFEIYNTIQA